VTFLKTQRAIVTDASVAVRFLLGDARWVGRWHDWVVDEAMLLVPPHFTHEVGNALLRSARIGAGDTVAALDDLFRLQFETADRGLAGLRSAIGLADRHRLTVYDSAYLELAIDTDAELATLDPDLRRAAEAEGVPVDDGA
jgi:predicted nucleic acid-binding protein